MAIGLTPNLEKGKCSICGKNTKVRVFFDPDIDKGFRICEKCAAKTKLTIEQGMKKYGKPMT